MSELNSKKISDCCARFCSASEKILDVFKGIQLDASEIVQRPSVDNLRAEFLAPANIYAEWLVAMLLLLWGNFCRDIVIVCSSQSVDIRKESASWHSADIAIKECKKLVKQGHMDVAAYEVIKDIIASSDSPAPKIAAARNLFAHRSHKSRKRFEKEFPDLIKSNKLGIVVCCQIVGAHVSQMEFWVRRLQTMVNQIKQAF